MRVEIHLSDQAQPIVRTNVRNTYVKDSLFCVLLEDDPLRVEKYPIADIFRITESY